MKEFPTYKWLVVYLIIVWTLLDPSSTASHPTLTYTSKTQKANFLPLLYQGPQFPFTVDIWMYIDTTPGHKFAIFQLETSFSLIIQNTDRRIYFECINSEILNDERLLFRRELKTEEILPISTWTYIALSLTSTETSVNIDSKRVSMGCIPQAPRHNSVFSLISHLESTEANDGKIHFRNLRMWKNSFTSSYLVSINNLNTMTHTLTKDLLLFAHLDDNTTPGNSVTLIDEGPYGQHMRGDNSNLFQSIETSLNKYSNYQGILFPKSRDIKMDISRINMQRSFTVTFWIFFDVDSLSADVISGSLDFSCPRDNRATLINTFGVYHIHFQNLASGNPDTYFTLNTQKYLWKAIYLSRDQERNGICRSVNADGTVYDTNACNDNYYPIFCDKVFFYVTQSKVRFRNFQLFNAPVPDAMMHLILFSNFWGNKAISNRMIFWGFSDDTDAPFTNSELPLAEMVASTPDFNLILAVSFPPICPPGTYESAGICLIATEHASFQNVATQSYSFALHNVQAEYGMLTMAFWMNTVTADSSFRDIIYLDNYIFSVQLKTQNINLRCRSTSTYFVRAQGIIHNRWIFYGISCGNYLEGSFVVGKDIFREASNGRIMASYTNTNIYIGHPNTAFYLKELSIWHDYKDEYSLRNMQYKTYGIWDYKKLKYLDFKRHGEFSGTDNDGLGHLRCPPSTFMNIDETHCLKLGFLGVRDTLMLKTSILWMKLDWTFEMVFKILSWHNSTAQGMKVMGMDGIFNISIIISDTLKYIRIVGLNEDGNLKFDAVGPWKIELGIQYHLAFTFTDTAVIVYLNAQPQQFTCIFGNMNAINNQSLNVETRGGILLLSQIRLWDRILTAPEIDTYQFARIIPARYKSLRLYYSMDEGQSAYLYETSQKWDSLRQVKLYTNLTKSINWDVYWDRFNELIICNSDYIYDNGNCSAHSGFLLFHKNECQNTLSSSTDMVGIEFTVEMWFMEKEDAGNNYIFRWGSANEVEIIFRAPWNYLTFRINTNTNYDINKAISPNVWTYFRCQLSNQTGSTWYEMRETIYYPRSSKYESTRTVSTPYNLLKSPIKLMNSDYHSAIGNVRIYTYNIPNSNKDIIPGDIYTHPDYTSDRLYAYYPFTHGFKDHSGKNNNIIETTTNKACETKFIEYFGEGMLMEEIEYTWNNIEPKYTFLNGIKDGCIFKYTFSRPIAIITDNYDIETCSDIVDSSTMLKLGNSPTCSMDENVISVTIGQLNTLTAGDNVDLISTSFFQNEISSANLRITYDGSLFPTFLFPTTQLLHNIYTTQIIQIQLFNIGTLTPKLLHQIFPVQVEWATWNVGALPFNITSTDHLDLSPIHFSTPGLYKIITTLHFAEANSYNYSTPVSMSASAPPFPIISGGGRTIHSPTPFTLDATQSIDSDLDTFSAYLECIWTCSLGGSYTDADCANLGNTSGSGGCILQMDTQTLLGKYTFKLALYKNGISALTETYIRVIGNNTQNIMDFSINTYGHKYPKYSTTITHYFGIIYHNNISDDIEWNINPGGAPNEAKSAPTLIIPEGFWLPSVCYNISLRLESTNIEYIVIYTSKVPIIEEYSITPNIGIGYSTVFELSVRGRDPEGTNIYISPEYRYSISPPGDSSYPLINVTSWGTNNTFSTKLPPGDTTTHGRLDIIIEIRGIYESITTVNISAYVHFLPNVIGNGAGFDSYITSALKDNATGSYIYNIYTLAQLVELDLYTQGGCGGCDLTHGICHAKNNSICECNIGYSLSPTCSLSDTNLLYYRQAITTLLKEIHNTTSGTFPLPYNSSIYELSILSLKRISSPIEILDREIESKISLILSMLIDSLSEELESQNKIESTISSIINPKAQISIAYNIGKGGFETLGNILSALEMEYKLESKKYLTQYTNISQRELLNEGDNIMNLITKWGNLMACGRTEREIISQNQNSMRRHLSNTNSRQLSTTIGFGFSQISVENNIYIWVGGQATPHNLSELIIPIGHISTIILPQITYTQNITSKYYGYQAILYNTPTHNGLSDIINDLIISNPIYLSVHSIDNLSEYIGFEDLFQGGTIIKFPIFPIQYLNTSKLPICLVYDVQRKLYLQGGTIMHMEGNFEGGEGVIYCLLTRFGEFVVGFQWAEPILSQTLQLGIMIKEKEEEEYEPMSSIIFWTVTIPPAIIIFLGIMICICTPYKNSLKLRNVNINSPSYYYMTRKIRNYSTPNKSQPKAPSPRGNELSKMIEQSKLSGANVRINTKIEDTNDINVRNKSDKRINKKESLKRSKSIEPNEGNIPKEGNKKVLNKNIRDNIYTGNIKESGNPSADNSKERIGGYSISSNWWKGGKKGGIVKISEIIGNNNKSVNPETKPRTPQVEGTNLTEWESTLPMETPLPTLHPNPDVEAITITEREEIIHIGQHVEGSIIITENSQHTLGIQSDLEDDKLDNMDNHENRVSEAVDISSSGMKITASNLQFTIGAPISPITTIKQEEEVPKEQKDFSIYTQSSLDTDPMMEENLPLEGGGSLFCRAITHDDRILMEKRKRERKRKKIIEMRKNIRENRQQRDDSRTGWLQYSKIFIRYHSFINPFMTTKWNSTQSDRLLGLSLELLLPIFITGWFHAYFNELEIFTKAAITFIALTISQPLILLVLHLISVIPTYNLTKRKEIIKSGIGLIIWFIFLSLSISLSIYFDTQISRSERIIWIWLFGSAIVANILILQPLKCTLIYACRITTTYGLLYRIFRGYI